MAKRNTVPPLPHESTGDKSDVFGRIYVSMLTSEAWQDLTGSQAKLYIACKAQELAQKDHPNHDQRQFNMNQSKWADVYHLYKRTNAKGFTRDMDALIAHGFIVCVFSGKAQRTMSVYKLSDMWQKWGTPAFKVEASQMTTSGRKKLGQPQSQMGEK